MSADHATRAGHEAGRRRDGEVVESAVRVSGTAPHPRPGRTFLQLRQVLRDSADGAHRALATQVLGYVRDKQSVVGDLVDAILGSRGPGAIVEAIRRPFASLLSPVLACVVTGITHVGQGFSPAIGAREQA